MNLVLRTNLSPSLLSQTLEGVVRQADRTVPIVRLREMEDVFVEDIQRPRLVAQLLGAFAGLALLLAAIGIYGVLSYMVVGRRREIGIRMALGADRSTIIARVMKRGLLLTTIGVGAGLAGAFGLNRLIASLLFWRSTERPHNVGSGGCHDYDRGNSCLLAPRVASGEVGPERSAQG
jgi:ABC-type antimicrobial peptide transport system permease subunit